MAPLVYFYQNDEDAMVAAVRQQTAMTHRHPDVIDSAAFFARVTLAVMQGTNPIAAMQDVVRNGYDRPPFGQWVDDGLRSCELATRDAISQFGQACNVTAGFPGVVHLIAKYQDNPREGLIENVMAGGDSAARGLIAGMVLGAFSGMDAIATEWASELNRGIEIQGFLNTLTPPSKT
jgi:ADP-ribosylglycohydrolase